MEYDDFLEDQESDEIEDSKPDPSDLGKQKLITNLKNKIMKKEFEITTQKEDLISQFNRRLKDFDEISKWAKKNVFRFVPGEWNISIQDANRLLIIHHSHYADRIEKKPLISFVNICNEIEKLGIKLDKEYTEYVGGSFDAHSNTSTKLENCYFSIHIRQCQVDKCEIEYEEKITKVPVLSGFCQEALN